MRGRRATSFAHTPATLLAVTARKPNLPVVQRMAKFSSRKAAALRVGRASSAPVPPVPPPRELRPSPYPHLSNTATV